MKCLKFQRSFNTHPTQGKFLERVCASAVPASMFFCVSLSHHIFKSWPQTDCDNGITRAERRLKTDRVEGAQCQCCVTQWYLHSTLLDVSGRPQHGGQCVPSVPWAPLIDVLITQPGCSLSHVSSLPSWVWFQSVWVARARLLYTLPLQQAQTEQNWFSTSLTSTPELLLHL